MTWHMAPEMRHIRLPDVSTKNVWGNRCPLLYETPPRRGGPQPHKQNMYGLSRGFARSGVPKSFPAYANADAADFRFEI